MAEPVISAEKAEDILNYLSRRRSVPIGDIGGVGPSRPELDRILSIAARVPDHGKLFPWYFVTFTGHARSEMGAIVREVYARKHPDAAPEQLAIEQNRFSRAPVVVAVISRRREGKTPWWEQILSAGAVCHNLMLAAHSSGYAAVWLTEWLAFDEEIKRAVGLELGRDHIAGFIYIGDKMKHPDERDRPEMANIVSEWAAGFTPGRGDMYDRAGFGFSAKGFDDV